jgi:hypothetical protein
VLDRLATEAARAGTPDKLHEAIHGLLVDPENAQLREDWRDLLVALAPLHHCARRLGLDPVEVFDAAAGKGVAPDIAQIAREFGRRQDITEASFGFLFEETEDGPEYWHVPWDVDLRKIPRSEREEFLTRRNEEFMRWVEENED